MRADQPSKAVRLLMLGGRWLVYLVDIRLLTDLVASMNDP
jgi:hypothetical protein